MTVDICLVAPGSAHAVYQGLSSRYSAIEPPTWALLIAESLRSAGVVPSIVDAMAEQIDPNSAAEQVVNQNPRLVCLVVYGQNVNAGTVGMNGAVAIAREVKRLAPTLPLTMIGSHVQALPKATLATESSIDFVFTNEGVRSLHQVLALSTISAETLSGIPGVAFRDDDGSVVINPAESPIPSDRLDIELPGYAWDLLPYREKPFDLYRAPLWHAGYSEANRTPYAAIQTSLGCNFGCNFCMINLINRDDDAEIGVASNYSGMRFWSTDFIKAQFDQLVDYGVRTIRVVDEMFLLYRRHYEPLCRALATEPYAKELRLWAYSRVDTVRQPEILHLLRQAGFRWLAIGIESASREVRLEVSKGKFADVDIRRVIEQIHEADIDVMANYIFGLPGDTLDSMQQTLELSLELATAGWNGYPAIALPGTELYSDALKAGVELPTDYLDYSFHSYETVPFVHEPLTPAEALSFRDAAFRTYHQSTGFRNRLTERFGEEAVRVVDESLEVDLRRRLLDLEPERTLDSDS